MDKTFINELTDIVGPAHTLTDRESLACYKYDSTPELESLPAAVVLPSNGEEVSRIMGLCHDAGVSVTARGSGTNLSGGSLACQGGVVMQTSRMNRILEIDEENLTATVEPGVITSTLHREVEAIGLFYPPDPGSMHISTMGGNVAENSGGLRGLKYGVTSDYVMGLKTVLANGELLKSGGKAVKNVAGYNLNDLLVSSEGTLGIFTDLRDRLKLERKLSDVETRLEESEKNAVLVALAGTAAHEPNQPLTSVMGYAELLKRKIKEGEAAHQYVDIIYREADRIKEIVRKIGKITKYETKPYVGNQEIIDLTRASSHED